MEDNGRQNWVFQLSEPLQFFSIAVLLAWDRFASGVFVVRMYASKCIEIYEIALTRPAFHFPPALY